MGQVPLWGPVCEEEAESLLQQLTSWRRQGVFPKWESQEHCFVSLRAEDTNGGLRPGVLYLLPRKEALVEGISGYPFQLLEGSRR